ncbi:alpha/beta fold hydrolase [Hydrogenophaga sp. BPS33]|uniref:alpha/beta fold hydrolase n=1 Tax=Hydrogenophaga sp. BPS33 TaxID=2651974 RepID=UPI00131FAF43|nr:alpha/beta fold hydrolase [Hydrogenophaga sp. BPS33]QHE85749.1 alpha/beta fold hydrolase [Hydrogenophaga sp. BPS33]
MTTPHHPTATLTSSDGIPICYRVHGPLGGLPVVALVHSLAMDHCFWDLQATRLEGKATVVAIDARGHGQSGHGPTPYTAARMAEDLREVLDHLDVPRAIVGGASMGGCIALQFAGSHPQRTAGLALIGTTAWYGPTAPKDWEDRAAKGRTQGLASLVDFQKTRWFSDAFRAQNPQIVQACIDTFLRNRIESYVATCHMLGHFDGRALLARIQVPTRILVGEEDYAAPVPMAQAMHAGIAHSHLAVIPNARHLAPLEVPDVVAHALLQLCAEAAQ